MSASLVDSFSKDFDAEEFTDEYQAELRTLIDAKLEQGDALDTDATFGKQEEEDGGEVIDLMEALRASVERSRAARGEKTEDAPKKKAPRRRRRRRRLSASAGLRLRASSGRASATRPRRARRHPRAWRRRARGSSGSR